MLEIAPFGKEVSLRMVVNGGLDVWGMERTFKFRYLEFNAVERSDTYRVNSSARPSKGRGAMRLLTAPVRALERLLLVQSGPEGPLCFVI